MPTKILLQYVQLLNPCLPPMSPRISSNPRNAPIENQKPSFGAVAVKLTDEQVREIKMAIKAEIEAKWPDPKKRPYIAAGKENETWFNENHLTQQKSGGMRMPLVWGASERPDTWADYEWCLLTKAFPENPPKVVERINGQMSEVSDPTKLYSGVEAHINVTITIYTKGTPGVGCYINGAMLTGRDLGRLGTAASVEEMFASIKEDTISTVEEDPMFAGISDSPPPAATPPAPAGEDWDDDISF